MNNRPLYHKLYRDMIRDKYPEKEHMCSHFLRKKGWTALDVIRVNTILFARQRNRSQTAADQRHRSYDEASILEILRYQQENELNNIQLANKFSLSRNTVAKWKKIFEEEIGV